MFVQSAEELAGTPFRMQANGDRHTTAEPFTSTLLDKYDVVVCGGGAAGIGAAYGARGAGAKVCLVESYGFLGGAATARNVASFCGLFTVKGPVKQVVHGVWNELRERLLEVGGTYELPSRHRGVFQVFDPEILKHVLDELLEDMGVHVLLHAEVVEAERVDGEIRSITYRERSGLRKIVGRCFVDATGEGDLAAHAGAAFRYGNPGGKTNLGSLATRFTGFAPDAVVSASLWRDAIVEAKAKSPQLAKRLHKDSGVVMRLPTRDGLPGDAITFLASASYDALSSESISRAEREGRQQAKDYMQVLRRLPGHENMALVASGPSFGTRESRHVEGRLTLSCDHFIGGARFDDCVALGCWASEFHDSGDPAWASSFTMPGGDHAVYDIPLRCLWSADTANLFVAGRCIDADRVMGASVRVMGTSLATGQGCGVAAAHLALKGQVSVLDVQKTLRAQGAVIEREEIGPETQTQ